MGQKRRKIAMQNESTYDLAFWLNQTPSERIAEVTRLIQKDLKQGKEWIKLSLHKSN